MSDLADKVYLELITDLITCCFDVAYYCFVRFNLGFIFRFRVVIAFIAAK